MLSGRTRSLALLASAALLAACGGDSNPSPSGTPTPTPLPSPPATSKVVLGYLIDADTSSANSLGLYYGYLNAVSADVFTVQSNGGVVGTVPTNIVLFDTGHSISTYACVTNSLNGAFDAGLAHEAMVTNRTQTVQSLVAVARSGNFQGVNIDFENLYNGSDIRADRAAFSAFIAQLGPALRGYGLKLVISVPAKEKDDPSVDWSYPFDYAALGAQADLVQVMTYDQHGTWSDPGPVAGRDWMERCIVFAKSQIPAAKLVIGLPAYGYDWDLTNTALDTSFTWSQVPGILTATGATVQYEASSDSPYINYTDSVGHRHQAWFENAQSITVKSALVKKHGLAGISMWRLGSEDLSFWTAVRAGLD